MAVAKIEGQILGERYQIEALIGQGGMSAVYKAYDPNLSRTVAIKIIHPHLSGNPDFVDRFREEAAAVARLRHPNIVQVFDFNQANDLYYMVMEFIVGETLQNRLERLNQTGRHLTMQQAVQFGLDICAAAEYAHQRGMIHRDIKPANVMLDADGKAILMDFGIARIVGGHQHTATGAVLGTALYMSPEQIQGLHADARADIYSLGVTLFEMFSGSPPFKADSAMTLMMMHLNDPVPDLRSLRPDVPPAIAGVLSTAMAKNRQERYQSANELGCALGQALEGQPSQPESRPAPSIPSARVEATFIESAGTPASPGATLIETGPQGAAGAQTTSPGGASARRLAPAQALQGTVIERPLYPAGSQAASGQAAAPISAPLSPGAAAYPVRRQGSRAWIAILGLLVLALAVGGGFYGYQRFILGGSPPGGPPPGGAALPAALPAPTDTQPALPLVAPLEPSATLTLTPQPTATDTPQPSLTPTVSATPTPAPLVIGGADKIAYLSGGDIWVANLDGSGLAQLTRDGAAKTYLRWLPDGQGLSYLSGKCIQTVSLSGEAQTVTCFNNSEHLESFEVSPDGTQVALSLDHQLYLLPFDLAGLAGASSHGDLASMASCAELAPYTRNFARSVRWSKDGTKWAALVIGVLKDGRRGDVVQVFSVGRCIPNPKVEIQFPQPHFTYKEYDRTPALESLAWDGVSLFSFHGNTRNDGFGDLHVFNMATFKASLALNPIGGTCCYRDPQWSPDGNYLLFAYQDYLQGTSSVTRLYYIPYGGIGAGGAYDPLPLPEITDPREKPQAVLRPAR